MGESDAERVNKRMRSNPHPREEEEEASSTKDGQVVEELSYVEFYSGVGGWTMALEQALSRISTKKDLRNRRRLRLRRLAALDHSDLCTRAFEHNFGGGGGDTQRQQKQKQQKSIRIEQVSLQQAEEWKASIWAMSPPCQPHTRQHENQSKDLSDPRSASFLHICGLLEKMDESKLPSWLFLENVVGFESSRSCRTWRQVLAKRNYRVGHFHLTPTQVGLPNDRPRYFCVAVRSSGTKQQQQSQQGGDATTTTTMPPHDSLLQLEELDTTKTTPLPPPQIVDHIAPLNVVSCTDPQEDTTATNSTKNLPTIQEFLDDMVTPEEEEKAVATQLRIPDKVLRSSAAWCFDIVSPGDQRSACFTHSYGKFIRGTGSVLYDERDARKIPAQILIGLTNPEDREFDCNHWQKGLDASKLRYFSPTEISRLFGFHDHFSFPKDFTLKQQWKLLGNSLNVKLASKIVELGLCSKI